MLDDPIRSVVRALNLLRTLNAREVWTLHTLHQSTTLPQTTFSHLLGTLISEGYVRAEAPAGTYRLAAKIRELDAGYTEHERLIDAGRPIALAVTKQIK
jgi:IclR family mhp operon transcriptional activator